MSSLVNDSPKKPPQKRGSNYPPMETAQELHEKEPAVTFNNAKDIHDNHHYGRYGIDAQVTTLEVRRARTIQLRPYETERMECLLTLDLDAATDPNLLIAAVEADLTAQLCKWEQKMRGYVEKED